MCNNKKIMKFDITAVTELKFTNDEKKKLQMFESPCSSLTRKTIKLDILTITEP